MASTLPQKIKWYKLKAVGHNTGETHDIIIGEYETPLDINGDGWNVANHTLSNIKNYLKSISKEVCNTITPFIPPSADTDWKKTFPEWIWQQYLNITNRGDQWSPDTYMIIGDYDDIGDNTKNYAYFEAGSGNRQSMSFRVNFADTASGGVLMYSGDSVSKWFSPNLAYKGTSYTNRTNSLVFSNYNANEEQYTAEQRNYWQGDVLMLMYFMGIEEDYTYKPDPNVPGGTSETGGGEDGAFDTSSDPIPIPNLPSLSAVDSGFVTIFNPTLPQVKDLAEYMWTANPTTIEFWKKLVVNPLDLIISLNILPFSIQDGNEVNVKVGFIDTGIRMTQAASQYQEYDCGTITVEKFWDNVMDYSPFTKAKLYLPFCGTFDVDIDELMGKDIQVVYHVDILTCSCTAMVKCDNAVLYTFIGQVGQNIPVSSADYSNLVSGLMQLGAAFVGAGVSGGAAAPAAAGMASSGAGTLLNGVPIEMTDPMVTGIPAGAPGGGPVASSGGGGGGKGIGIHGAMQTVGNVMALKPSFVHSGSLSGPGGLLSVQYPYLILERPRQSLPKDYRRYNGYPSNITATLNSLSGYTEVESIRLDGIPATTEELKMIESALKSGVVL